MKHIFAFLLVLTVSGSAFAQSAKVIKVKGQQAIVQFPSGTKPQVGQIIDVGDGGDEGEDGGDVGVGNKSRARLLGVSGEISFLNNSATSKSTTTISITPKYGWNTGVMEFGPQGTIALTSSDGASSRTLSAGGFFDFNFVPNDIGQTLIYGVGGEAEIGQASTSVGSGPDATSTVIHLFAGGNVKWFGLADSWALRGDVGYDYTRTSPSTGSASTESGILVKAGIATYF